MSITKNSSDTTNFKDLISQKRGIVDYLKPLGSLIAVCIILSCVCLKYTLEKLRLRLNTSPVMLLTGFIVGYLFYVFKYEDIAKLLFNHESDTMLFGVIPILMYNICMSFDTNLLSKLWGVIMIVSIPGFFIHIGILGLIFNRTSPRWYSLRGFLIAVMLVPVYPMDVMVYLKKQSVASRMIITILQGESLLTTCFAFIFHQLMVDAYLEKMVKWWEFLRFLCTHFIGELIVGYLSAKFTLYILRFVTNNPVRTVLLSWFSLFVPYCCVNVVFGRGSGLILLTMQGCLVVSRKRRLSNESKRFLENFWSGAAICSNNYALFVVGVIAGFTTLKSPVVEDFAFICLTYIGDTVTRLLEFLSIYYFLKLTGQGITFEYTLVLIWAGILSVMNLALIIQTVIGQKIEILTPIILLHGTGLVLLTMLINVTTLPSLLNCLELNKISLVKQSNMNKCIRKIMSVRYEVIGVLKLEKFLCDANWPFIHEATTLTHPFKMENIRKYEELENELEFEKVAICPECRRGANIISTVKEYEDLIREARRRVLTAKQVSYSRQYENGMLSFEGIQFLKNEVEVAMEEDFKIKIENIKSLFKSSNFLSNLRLRLLRAFHDKTDDLFIKKPRIAYRRVLFSIVFNPAFDYVMCAIVLANVAMSIVETIMRFQDPDRTRCVVFKASCLIFLLLYLMEFVVKVLALSFLYVWTDGVEGYFRSKWRKIEFACLVLSFLIVILEVIEQETSYGNALVIFMCCLGLLRVVRLYRIVYRLYPLAEKCIDSRIDRKMTLAYDVGKAFITASQDVLNLLPTIVLMEELIDQIRSAIEFHRFTITKQLVAIQRERPLIPVNAKTKECIETILSAMYEAINELKHIGRVDAAELKSLRSSVNFQQVAVRKLGFIELTTPRSIFEEIPWMSKDVKVLRYLWANSKKVHYDPGEYVCVENEKSEGIYIIVSGLFKLIYQPDEETLKKLNKSGVLPVIDQIMSPDFFMEREDFLLTGNTFGELSFLTGLPYACYVVADSYSQVMFVRSEVIEEAMKMEDDIFNGLKARMWTVISLKLAYGILVKVSAYFAVPKREIEFALLRAFVPDLEGVTCVQKNDMILDIVLINGMAMDHVTKIVYCAPCYIPRNVQRIELSPNKSEDIPTKLLFIAEVNADENLLRNIIMNTKEETS